MMDNPFFLAIGSIMVLLLVAAWLFPNQKWLEPFRAHRPAARVRAPKPSDPSASLPAFQFDRPAAPAPTHIETMLAARQRSFQRFSRIYAGFSIMVAGVVILFGHYVLSAMTASDPDEDPGRLIAVSFAVLFFIVGAAVASTHGRDR